MEKYITNKQRREIKLKKRKRIIWICLLGICLCVIGTLFFWYFHDGENGEKAHVFANQDGSLSIVQENPESIPEYSGEDCITLNDGKPGFIEWDVENIIGEYYSELDRLGRCGVAYAMLDKSMMPTEERGDIGQIKPTGWVQNKYEGIVDSTPPYLYNRSHLIAYALTGQNANERNLITGTRYMNAKTMLLWEEKVMRYLDKSDNHVLYRVTPYFKDKELLARGVELEAYSVEDQGASLSFHVFVYNVQPGIILDYATGENKAMK